MSRNETKKHNKYNVNYEFANQLPVRQKHVQKQYKLNNTKRNEDRMIRSKR